MNVNPRQCIALPPQGGDSLTANKRISDLPGEGGGRKALVDPLNESPPRGSTYVGQEFT